MQPNNNVTTSEKNEGHGPIDALDINAASKYETWKAVGRPSWHGSMSMAAINSNNMNNKNSGTNECSDSNTTLSHRSPAVSPTPNSLSLPSIRRTSLDQSQWGAMGGFHWDGPDIFDHETRKASLLHPAQALHRQQSPSSPLDVLGNDTSYITHHHQPLRYSNNILSVPMLPNISAEPVYRQQRSLSFSVGQDPTLFGYDGYTDTSGPDTCNKNNNTNQGVMSFGYKHLLATMEEEDRCDDDDEDDDGYNGTPQQDMIDQSMAAQWRTRSQSSGAAFGVLSPAQRAKLLNLPLQRGPEQHDPLAPQQRRHLRFFGDIRESATITSDSPIGTANAATGQHVHSQTSIGGKDRMSLLHHRLFQTYDNEYKFPDQSQYPLPQRRQSLTMSLSHHTHIQQLSDQLENTSLHATDVDPTLPETAALSIFGQPFQQQSQQQQQQQQQLGNQHHRHQRSSSLAGLDVFHTSDNKGIPLQDLPPNTTLHAVEFKAGRPDYFYVVPETNSIATEKFRPGMLVIVEGDRGKDLGKVASNALSVDDVQLLLASKRLQQPQNNGPNNDHVHGTDSDDSPKDMYVKRLYRMATSNEIDRLLEKGQDEMQALALCQQKVKLRYLPMSVVDAEYQWDRRKLTFFFVSNRRIDFRELVRELFKIYKTRIWMRAVNTNISNTTSVLTIPPSSDIISSV